MTWEPIAMMRQDVLVITNKFDYAWRKAEKRKRLDAATCKEATIAENAGMVSQHQRIDFDMQKSPSSVPFEESCAN